MLPSPLNVNLNSHARDVNCFNRLFCCVSAQGNGNIQINTNDQVSNNDNDKKDEQSTPSKKTDKKKMILKNFNMPEFEEEVIVQQTKQISQPVEEDEEQEINIRNNINKNLVFEGKEFRLENSTEEKISQKFAQVSSKFSKGKNLKTSEQALLLKGKKMRQLTATAFYNGMTQYGHIQREIYFTLAKVDPLSCYKECNPITVKDQQEIKKAYLLFAKNEKILKVIIKRIQLATKFLELNPDFTLYPKSVERESLEISHELVSPGFELTNQMENLSISKNVKMMNSRGSKNNRVEDDQPILVESKSHSPIRKKNEIVHNSSAQMNKIDVLFLRVAHQVGCFDPVDIKRLGRKMRKLDVATLQEAYALDVKHEYKRISETCVDGIIAIVQACEKAYLKMIEKSNKQGISMQAIFEEVLSNCLSEAKLLGDRNGSMASEFLFLEQD